jgi:hypothetical protein
MRLVLVSALLLAPAAVFASAPQGSAPAQTAAAPAPAVKEKKICRMQDAGSTSRMRKRVCRTVKEWSDEGRNGTNSADLERLSQ